MKISSVILYLIGEFTDSDQTPSRLPFLHDQRGARALRLVNSDPKCVQRRLDNATKRKLLQKEQHGRRKRKSNEEIQKLFSKGNTNTSLRIQMSYYYLFLLLLFLFFLLTKPPSVGVWSGMSKGVEDGYRLPALQAG
jgi:hypothetical protein